MLSELDRKERRRAYMRAYGKQRVRTKEQRREEYLRRRDRIAEQYIAQKNTEKYARKYLAQEMGLPIADVPSELCSAKQWHLALLRKVREIESNVLPPAVAEAYSRGLTLKQVAEKFSIDRNRAKRFLVESGVFPRPRPDACVNGHPWSEANNLAYTREGYRRCRACAREKARLKKARGA